MTRTNKILLLVFGIIILFFIVYLSQVRTNQKINQGNSSQSNTTNSQKDKFSPQENEVGNVTVSVKPKILKVGEKPLFEIEFNTHSVDLSFDIPQASSLIDDKGGVLTMPKWNGTGPGGHHRSGTLTFNTPIAQTTYAELIIKNVAEVAERKFRWEL